MVKTLFLLAAGLAAGCSAEAIVATTAASKNGGQSGYPLIPGKYVSAVQRFADIALKHGRDESWSAYTLETTKATKTNPIKTPLFLDALTVNAPHRPLHYLISARGIKNGYPKECIPANFSLSLQLQVVLRELGRLTGDTTYPHAAERATDFALKKSQKQQDGTIKGGLIYPTSRLGLWGNHATYDALNEKVIGNAGNTAGTPSSPALPIHEMEHNFPDLRWLSERDQTATREYLEGYIKGSIKDWSLLSFTRHIATKGSYAGFSWKLTDKIKLDLKVPTGSANSPDYAGYQIFYYAFWHYRLFGEQRAWKLGYQMLKRFMDARHKGGAPSGTQLGPMAYINNPGNAGYTTLVDSRKHRYSQGVAGLLKMADAIFDRPADADKRKTILSWALEELKAFGEHKIIPKSGQQWAYLKLDATKDNSSKFKVFEYTFWAYTMGYRLADAAADKKVMWGYARDLAQGFGLGDIGAPGGASAKLNFDSYKMQPFGSDVKVNRHSPNNENAFVIHGLLELYRSTKSKAYLRQAAFQADNLIKRIYRNGLFARQDNGLYARLGDLTPLALLDLEAAIQGVELARDAIMPRNIYARPKIIADWPDSNDVHIYFGRTGKIIDVKGEPPKAPGAFTAVAAPGTVTLSWTDVTGETGYRIERLNKVSGLPDLAVDVPADATGFVDQSPGPPPGRYRIRSYSQHGYSHYAITTTAAAEGELGAAEPADAGLFDGPPEPMVGGDASTTLVEEAAGSAGSLGGGCSFNPRPGSRLWVGMLLALLLLHVRKNRAWPS